MMEKSKKISHKGIPLQYRDRGSGACIVLLHGYLETGSVWDTFVPLLLDRFRVLVPDLPGHGKSGCWGEEHSMDELAEAVVAMLNAEGIDRALIVGHSMGGYVSMAFADLFPERMSGYVLFHSTCFADNPEKKQNREREISLVKCGRKQQIIVVNIPRAFADENVDRLSGEVDYCQDLALENNEEGIVALLNGMKSRPDRSGVLSNPVFSLLLIGGEKDNYIPMEVFEKLVALAPHATILRLQHSGHMGFIEEPQLAAAALVKFGLRCGPGAFAGAVQP